MPPPLALWDGGAVAGLPALGKLREVQLDLVESCKPEFAGQVQDVSKQSAQEEARGDANDAKYHEPLWHLEARALGLRWNLGATLLLQAFRPAAAQGLEGAEGPALPAD
eukprot:CAMPEP_0183525488 /NCGR_PEP_ID=MMETSP0371-20130417/20681_1 /TAXON_ID=268820 /ORGANISM="Peridinium aciculiferum, Strain PAER-2" /LENGTH=108 /DNA_ID=CAMNT_0025724731 /DNA_START=138 /DNA_END=462 /DNA_ORIENTATION=+